MHHNVIYYIYIHTHTKDDFIHSTIFANVSVFTLYTHTQKIKLIKA